jgi:hypothetical protein
MGLAAPSLEHERTVVVIPVDGAQPEAENLQDDMQESLTQEENLVVNTRMLDRRERSNEQEELATRMSSRIAGQSTTIGRVDDGVRHHTQTGLFQVPILTL